MQEVLKNYTLRNTNKILYYITYCRICTDIWTLQNRSRFGRKKIIL